MLTREQAVAIVEAHEIDRVLDDEEEVLHLRDHNPELLDAYVALMGVAELVEE